MRGRVKCATRVLPPRTLVFGSSDPRSRRTFRSRRRSPRRDKETEDADPASTLRERCGRVKKDEEDIEPLETSLESLDEGQDDQEEDAFFKLDEPVEDADEDDEDNVLDDEEDDEWR